MIKYYFIILSHSSNITIATPAPTPAPDTITPAITLLHPLNLRQSKFSKRKFPQTTAQHEISFNTSSNSTQISPRRGDPYYYATGGFTTAHSFRRIFYYNTTIWFNAQPRRSDQPTFRVWFLMLVVLVSVDSIPLKASVPLP